MAKKFLVIGGNAYSLMAGEACCLMSAAVNSDGSFSNSDDEWSEVEAGAISDADGSVIIGALLAIEKLGD